MIAVLLNKWPELGGFTLESFAERWHSGDVMPFDFLLFSTYHSATTKTAVLFLFVQNAPTKITLVAQVSAHLRRPRLNPAVTKAAQSTWYNVHIGPIISTKMKLRLDSHVTPDILHALSCIRIHRRSDWSRFDSSTKLDLLTCDADNAGKLVDDWLYDNWQPLINCISIKYPRHRRM